MGMTSSSRIENVPKTMSREELIDLRDTIANGRNYASLAATTAGILGFIPGSLFIGGTLYIIGVSLGIAFAFTKGANDRIQTLLDKSEDSYDVVLKTKFDYETISDYLDNKPTKVTYLDVIL